MQCGNGIDENELKRTVDMRASRKQDFDFDIIAINGSGELLFARRYKNEPPPRQWAEVRLEKRKHKFPHCQYMQSP